MLKKLFLTFSCMAMLSMALLVSAQPFSFKTFSLSEGLPQSQVTCTHIDQQGYLWIGTNGGGLCRYDGKEFEMYNADKGMTSNFIRCMGEDQNGRLYVGTNRGMYVWSRNFHLTDNDGVPVNAISGYGKDSVLVGYSNQLKIYSFQDQGYHSLSRDSIGNVLSICHKNNFYWIGTSKGLWKLDPKSGQLDFAGKMIGQGIFDMAEGDADALWLASWNAGIIKYNISLAKIDTVIHHIALQLPQCIYNAGKGILWVGTQNKGLSQINLPEKKITTYSEKDGLPHLNIKSISPGIEDQLWIGTSGGGLVLGMKQNFRSFEKSDGLASNRVYSIDAGHQNDVWLATGSTVQHFDSSGFTSYNLDSLTQGAKCKTIAKDRQGRIWIGTEGKGVVVLAKNKTIPIDRRYGLPDPYIQKIAMDSLGKIWVATFTNGLFTVALDSNQHVVVTPHIIPFRKISSLWVGKNNLLWIGSNDGRLVSLKNDAVEITMDTAAALPPTAIKSMAEDTFGRLWIGTEGRGVYFKGKADLKFESLKGKWSLNSQNIYLVRCDEQNNIWVGTEKGVSKIGFEKDGRIASVTAYGPEEGFTGIETCHDASIVDDQGNLWFGTMNGLLKYTPGQVTKKQIPPRIHFENISLFYKALVDTKYMPFVTEDNTLLPNTTFDYRDNHLNFEFKAVDLSHPEDLWYHWKMNDIERSWSPPTHQTSINYAAMHPGSYTLQVEASADTILWSEPIAVSFNIKPAYWQTTSFRFGALAFGVLVISFMGFGWTRSIKKKESARRKQLEIENHILQLEQKALQLQMNPHFLFNALTSIKSLVGKSQLEEAQNEINAFALLMRGILNNSRKQKISLAEEIRVLDAYLHMEQLCHQYKFQYQVDVDPSLDAEEIEIPPMLIQPFVENAIVHGISPLSKEGKVNIDFSQDKDLLVCRIQDNGIGREKAARLRAEKKPGHQPVAMEVTKERLIALRNDKLYDPLIMDDILDPAGNVAGTLVIIKLPLQTNW